MYRFRGTIEWVDGSIRVRFSNQRTQIISYEHLIREIRLASKVASSKQTEGLGTKRIARRILQWSSETPVVAFGLTRDFGIEAFCVLRWATLQRDELLFYLSTLAREADRRELLLSGEDEF